MPRGALKAEPPVARQEQVGMNSRHEVQLGDGVSASARAMLMPGEPGERRQDLRLTTVWTLDSRTAGVPGRKLAPGRKVLFGLQKHGGGPGTAWAAISLPPRVRSSPQALAPCHFEAWPRRAP